MNIASLTPPNGNNATPLQLEKAKVKALTLELSRSKEEKTQMQNLLKKSESNLVSLKKTLRVQSEETKECLREALEKKERPRESADGEVRKLKIELASTKRALADELIKSKRREEKLNRVQSQQLLGQRQEARTGNGGNNVDVEMQKVVKNLEHQRSALLALVKKQMKLIEIEIFMNESVFVRTCPETVFRLFPLILDHFWTTLD